MRRRFRFLLHFLLTRKRKWIPFLKLKPVGLNGEKKIAHSIYIY